MLFGIALYGSVTTMIAQLLAQGMQKSTDSMKGDVVLQELYHRIREANLSEEEKKRW